MTIYRDNSFLIVTLFGNISYKFISAKLSLKSYVIAFHIPSPRYVPVPEAPQGESIYSQWYKQTYPDQGCYSIHLKHITKSLI